MPDWATEHLVNFLLDLCAAFLVTWLFFRYQPRFSDYRSKRSLAAARRKAAKLEEQLTSFERSTEDIREFMGRLINHATRGLINCLFMFALAATGIFQAAFFHEDRMLFIISQVVMFILANLFFVLFRWRITLLRVEASPETYKQRLRERIDRLRAVTG
jgi:hypothetical protein